MSGFKIAEAYVQVTAKDDTEVGARRIRERLNRIRGTAKVHIDVDTLSMNRAAASVKAASRQIEHSIRRTGSAAPALSRITGAAFGAAAGLTALSVAGGTAGAALAALPVLGAAVGGMAATVVGAFSGVGAALKGYSADQKAAQKAGASAAATAAANARQIRDAQQSIADARRQQARVAEDSAERIADAERDAARTAEQGARQIESATQRVADALDDERKAQEDLTQARRDAARQLDDLREQVSDYALDEEGAAIRVERAQERLTETLADSGASALDVREARLDLAEAEERLSDVQRERTRDTAALADAEKRGVDGAEGVISAQERLTGAARGVQEAQRDLARTQQEVDQANQDAARAVTEARESAAEAQEDAARQVASAMQGLADVQAQQAESAMSGAAATSQYAEAMAKLTPAGRAFVEQLLAMKPLVMGLRDTAQGAFLPGLTQMLRDSEGLFPIFKDNLRATGEQMGETAVRWGQMFKDETFKKNLDALFKNSLPVVAAIGEGLRVVTEKWVNLGAQSGLAEGVARGLTALFDGIGRLLDSLAPYAGQFGELFENVMTVISGFLPILGSTLGMLATAVNLLGPALGPVIAGLAGMFIATKVAAGISAVTTAFNVLKLAFAISPFGVIMIAISGLVAALIYAWNNSETFRNVVKRALETVGTAATWLWRNAIEPAFRGIAAVVTWLWQNIIQPYIGFYVSAFRNVLAPAALWLWRNVIEPAFRGIGSAISWVWGNVIKPTFDFLKRGVDGVGQAFSSTVDWIRRSWDSIREAARRPVQWVVDVVYNNGIRRVWNGVAGMFGLPQLGEVRFASGGIMPGYTPGRDVHLAALSGGEAIMRPEWTRAAGADYVHAANRAARFGGTAGASAFIERNGLPAYATGGIFGQVPHFAEGGIFDKVVDWVNPMAWLRGLFAPLLGGRPPGGGGWVDAMAAVPGRIVDGIVGAVKRKFDAGDYSGGNALAWAKTQHGKPYVWGAVGPGGYDCSGFMSAIVNVMRGRSPHSRVGSTGTFPWSGFRPGYGPGNSLTIGSFKGNPGHMAGTLAGVNVESRGGRGVIVGAGARGASDPLFNTRAHLPFDLGGVAQGRGYLAKDTLRPERVLSPDQTVAFERLVAAMEGRAGYGDVHVHVTQISGSPAETGRFVALGLRSVG